MAFVMRFPIRTFTLTLIKFLCYFSISYITFQKRPGSGEVTFHFPVKFSVLIDFSAG